MSLRIGHIDYLNCVPFFHHISVSDEGDSIITGTPAELNAMLARGEIDLCPASSFEYGQRWSDYQLLPDLSISALGAVKSVLLFSTHPLTELAQSPIAITGESATSVHLLQILLREYCGFDKPHLYRPECSVEEIVSSGGAGLLIGDRALRAAKAGAASFVYDLGELWHSFCGLPFVFALWIVRQDSVETKEGEVGQFLIRLQKSLGRAMADLPALAGQVSGGSCLNTKELLAYWQTMSFGLTEAYQQGLNLFYQLAVKYRFMKSLPELKFFVPPFPLTDRR